MHEWLPASKQMLALRMIAAFAAPAGQNLGHWIYRLGGLGFIPLGLLDNSVIPVPGSMDVLTIFLSARQEQLWLYYALMATAGSVIGGYATYRLARRGGKSRLARKIPRHRFENAYKIFGRWGFAAIAIPALLPPPVPMVPFLLAAGAMRYPLKKFLIALTLGRMTRYTLLAFLGARHGRTVFAFFSQLPHPVLWAIVISTAVAAVIFLLIRLSRRQSAA